MQFRPPGTMVSAQRGAETERFGFIVMQHIGDKSFMYLSLVSSGSFLTARHV